MESVIVGRARLPREVEALLPAELLFAVESSGLSAPIEEIRIRAERPLWVCGGGENLMLDRAVSRDELDEVLLRACGGSIYSSLDSIKRGYICAKGGVRVGVSGEWTSGGVRNVVSLAIRVPRRISLDASGVRRLLDGFGMSRGLLLFSPPLGGKTSLLREIARELSSGARPLRVVVVDSRGELAFSLDGSSLCLDVLSGYPKKEGIEIAARTLGAQVVICDEIGAGESDAVCELHGGGVPLIASAHAAGLSDLLCRRGIAELHRARVFGGYMRVTRGSPPYVFYPWEAGDDS